MTTVVDPFLDMPPVGLDELVRLASLQTRLDRKYVVAIDRLPEVLELVGSHARVLEIDGRRHFTYVSTYLDTPDWMCFRAAATARPRRFKVRTRTYVDSGETWAEVKLRSPRGHTVKHRLALGPTVDDATAPTCHRTRAFAAEVIGDPQQVDRLVPALTTRYDRATLLVPGGRVTIDLGVRAGAPGRDRPVVSMPDHLVVETKSDVNATDVDHALRRLDVRPVSISKFAIGVAGLRPDLPANRWRRVIDRYVHVDP